MNRGMKKWAPYKSLNEQADFINKMYYEKHKIEKPKISSDVADDINEILTNYQNELLTITYFDDGYVYSIDARIYKIDIIKGGRNLPPFSMIFFSEYYKKFLTIIS